MKILEKDKKGQKKSRKCNEVKLAGEGVFGV